MLQGTQLKRLLSLIFIAECFGWASHIGSAKFVPIYEPLVIKAQRNSPAYVAFEEVFPIKKQDPIWTSIENKNNVLLGSERGLSMSFARYYEQKIILNPMTLQRVWEPYSDGISLSGNDSEWINQLPPKEKIRLQEAQTRSDILNQEWSEPGFAVQARRLIEQSSSEVKNPWGSSNYINSKIFVSATDSMGNTKTEPARPTIEMNQDSLESSLVQRSPAERSANNHRITGPIEITGGLAVTNEHHIEIRRNDEGKPRELGEVNLKQGTYNIEINDVSGSLVGQLIDNEGKVLGEGSINLSVFEPNANITVKGPRLRVEPLPSFSVVVNNFYSSKSSGSVPTHTQATFIKGISDVSVKRDGIASMDNIAKGSSTVLRVAAPKFLQTNQLIVCGQETKAFIYPETMISALQDIVAQQRSFVLEGLPTVIWGRVALDGKTVSGIEISVESDPSLQAIYFNQFMLPDPNLKATSDNGLYAFINVTPGFHSLLATRSNGFFGYSNVVVEEGSVAQGDIDSAIKAASVPLKVFDAFTGQAYPSTITMQSLPDEIAIDTGSQLLILPHLNRIGMMHVRPQGADYISARYLYNDSDEYIHIPLVQFSWLRSLKASLKIDDSTNGGVIVGFVENEDFEVYIAGHDEFDQRNIVLFDKQGRALQNKKGIGGGGFIIYNVPEDTHEIVVVGSASQKIYSRVIPVDSNSLTVLNFR